MKKLLYAVCLLAVACHRDVFPNDLLYQRWQLVQYRQDSGAWTLPVVNVLRDTEYRPDGRIVYRENSQVRSTQMQCCTYRRFERQQNDITFINDISCINASCSIPSKDTATITQLTTDLLELTNGQTVSQYKSVK